MIFVQLSIIFSLSELQLEHFYLMVKNSFEHKDPFVIPLLSSNLRLYDLTDRHYNDLIDTP